MIHYYLSDSNGQAFTRLVVGDGLSAVVETGDDGLAELRIGATGSITETDPVFTAWLATPPALSIFTNDNGFITDISGLTAGAVTSLSGHNVSELNNDAGYSTGGGSETDPIFTAWLAAPGNSPSFSALNLTDGAGSGYFTWSSSTGVMLYNSNNNLTALTVGWIYGDGSGLTGVLTDASAFATAAQGALADTALQSLTGHNVSELTNDAGFITDISGLTAGAVTSLSGHNVSELNNDAGYSTGGGGGSETDPIFTAWLAAPGNSPSFSALNLTDGAGSGYFTWSSSTGVVLYNSNNNLTALTVGWIYGDGSGLTGVLTDASAFATAAQGALADTALQSLTGHNVSELNNDAGFLTDISGLTAGAVTSLSGHNVSELNNDAGYYVGDGSAFATAAQGALADTALQPTGDGGALSLASYIPTTPSNWGGIPPSTLAEALDRIAYNLVLAGFTP